MDAVDPAWVEGWLKARSVARGLAAPVRARGGFRVETGSAKEMRRWVFAAPGDGLATLAREITTPRVFLKLCAHDQVLMGMLPERWQLQPRAWLMGCAQPMPAAVPAAGYRLDIARDGDRWHAQVFAGAVPAASGHAAVADGVFVYDRIETDPAHRRRGLGRAVMAALGAARPAGARQLLVATDAGRQLYESIGWRVHAPYASAVIPD